MSWSAATWFSASIVDAATLIHSTPVSDGRPPTALALLSVLLLLTTACGGWRGHGDTYYAERKLSDKVGHEATYSFGLPPKEWKPATEKGAQVLWVHESMPALIHIRAQCEMHGDSSLESFTDHLRIDFREWKVLSQEPMILAERDALHSVILAEIDGGIATQLELIVFKKNGCLFDIQYIAAPEVFERGRPAYQQVVADFKFPIRG